MLVRTQKELNTIDTSVKMARNFITSMVVKEKLHPAEISINWKQGMYRKEVTEYKRWSI